MPKEVTQLFEAAKAAQQHAYSPYSGFKVGAAILADDGNCYFGCNVENAAYPLGQCAEASAISAMIAGGGKQIARILILSPDDSICAPCGGCRQKIREFASPDTEILLSDKQGNLTLKTIEELLPLAFDLS